MNEKFKEIFKKFGKRIAAIGIGITAVIAFICNIVYKVDRTGSSENPDSFGRFQDGIKDTKRYNRDATKGIERAQEILSEATAKQNGRRD